uniref:Uncharacterized protein n=1 Tax=Oryza rufipogon TaxID=4529 RepID=A0A0E0PIL3_ORYRU
MSRGGVLGWAVEHTSLSSGAAMGVVNMGTALARVHCRRVWWRSSIGLAGRLSPICRQRPPEK